MIQNGRSYDAEAKLSLQGVVRIQHGVVVEIIARHVTTTARVALEVQRKPTGHKCAMSMRNRAVLRRGKLP